MKIRLAADLQKDSIVDGEGIRTVIWTQGCSHNCNGCHNPQTHSFKDGVEVELDIILNDLEELVDQDGITLSGGDPFFQTKACLELVKKAHSLNMNVWAYTGFTYEEIIKSKDLKELFKEIDILIDGKFDITKKSFNTPFIGSSNQRIIDVKESIKNNKLTLYNKLYASHEKQDNKRLFI